MSSHSLDIPLFLQWSGSKKILAKTKTKEDEVAKALTCVFFVAVENGELQLWILDAMKDC